MINTAITPDSNGDYLYARVGHFTVGDRVYYDNYSAMKSSHQTKTPIKWHFFNDVWSKSHAQGLWKNLTLPTLYRQRALQIRQQYEHVSLLFSGGWDSRNILDTFDRENIRLDAIVIYTVPELENTTNYNNHDSANWYGEVKFNAVPYAKEFCRRHPETKLIEIPWLDYTIEKYIGQMDELAQACRVKPGVWFGCRLSVSRSPKMLKELGYKNGCLLSGIDKPCIIHHGLKQALGFFPEGLLRFASYPTKSFGFQENQIWEPFYWTPNLPELAIRGWYELLNLCHRDSLVARAHDSNTSTNERMNLKMSQYVQDRLREMLYRQFDPTVWQPDKQREWGFFMSNETPIINLLNKKGLPWKDMLSEVLIELNNTVGEENLIIGSQQDQNTAVWINKFISDNSTVLAYQNQSGQMIDLDMNVIV